jgi:hypothetical protein
MTNEQLRYVIFNYAEVDKIDFNQVFETSIETLRLTQDGLLTFVKWIGDEPQCVSNLTSKSIIYNNEEMLDILDQPEWVGDIPISGTTVTQVR